MIRVTCYIRPHVLEPVKAAVASLGVNGMSVSDVRGVGNSSESSEWFAGEGGLVPLPIRAKLEVVAPDALREEIVQAILQNAATGQPGDGKIFIEPILDALRIRTLERGDGAV